MIAADRAAFAKVTENGAPEAVKQGQQKWPDFRGVQSALGRRSTNLSQRFSHDNETFPQAEGYAIPIFEVLQSKNRLENVQTIFR